MRGDVPEGVGMREKHQDARHDAVNTQVVSALAGVHPIGGAVRPLLLRAPADSGRRGAMNLCAVWEGKGVRRCAGPRASERARKGRRWLTGKAGDGEGHRR